MSYRLDDVVERIMLDVLGRPYTGKASHEIMKSALISAYRRGCEEAGNRIREAIDPEHSYSTFEDLLADFREQQTALREISGGEFGLLADPGFMRRTLARKGNP